MLQSGIDNQLLLMNNQTITANTNGTIVLDLLRITSTQPAPQAYQLNVAIGAATLTAGHAYTFIAQSANDNAFAQMTVEARQIVSNANGLTANNVYVVAFSPLGRYVRLRVEVAGASPSVVVDKAWLSPATVS